MSNPWVKPDVYLQEMDIYEARRQVLADLLRRKFENKRAQLARDAQVSPSYLTRLLQPPGEGKAFKRIETDMALKLEQNLGLAPGSLLSPLLDRSSTPDYVLTDGGKVVAVIEAKAPRPLDVAPPPPDPKFTDTREISDSDWATLEAVKLFIPEHELKELRERADRFKAKVRDELTQVVEKAKPKQ